MANVRVFVILRLREGLTPSIKITVLTFRVNQKFLERSWVFIFLEYAKKHPESNLAFVVVLVPEAKGLD